MRYLAVITLLILALVMAQPVAAQSFKPDLKAGFAAYIKSDFATVLKHFRPLAEQGHADGQFWLGHMYGKGYGVTKDYAEALRWYRKAAEQGDAAGQSMVGLMYQNGQGVAKDYVEAVKWYSKAAKQGHELAQYSLASLEKQLRAEGNWPPKPRQAKAKPAFTPDYKVGEAAWKQKDYATALRHWRPLAKQGHVRAQFWLGYMYLNSKGVTKDYAEALRWFRKAAKQGHALAQWRLGNMYRWGQGVTKDTKEAVRWWRKAAKRGHAAAQYLLGDMYRYGQGVTKDYKEAVRWYRKAAEQGHSSAQYYLALFEKRLRAEGNWPPQSRQARAKPAFTPDLMAGWMAYLKKDYATALRHYRPLAEQGHARAQIRLGFMYHFGEGVTKDPKEAVRWIRKAAKQGDALAKTNLASLEKQLRAEDNRPPRPRQASKPPSSIGTAPSASKQQKELERLRRENARLKKEKQAKPKKVAKKTSKPKPVQKLPKRPVDVAVIIANSNYKKQGKDIPNVDPAYNDAKSIKKYFMESLGVREGNIIYLKDATGAQLMEVFGNKDNHKAQLFNWVRPNKSNVYVYYAGHGAPASKDGSAYLVPSDANSQTIEFSGYPLTNLYRNLGKIKARSVTVILEACFSGFSQAGALLPRSSGMTITPKEPTVPSNVKVISAGAADQMASWEKDESQSLFTKYFLLAMRGEGDKKPYGNGDGKVEDKELQNYLDDTMTYFARRYYGRDQRVQIVKVR